MRSMLYSKRASLLTISSFMKLCNGYGCSRNFMDCIKMVSKLRTISTAAERSDFQFSGGYQTDVSLGHQKSHAGFYEESYNNADSQKLLNRQSPVYVAQTNTNPLTHTEQNQHGLNQNWGYTGGVQNEYMNKVAEHGGNFGGSRNKHGSSEKISYGAGRIADGGHISISGNGVQNNLIGHNGSFNGYYGQSNTKMQQNLVGLGVDNSRGFGKHPNAFVESYNVQRSIAGSHLSNNAKPDGESAEASNGSPYRGTLEELDSFCMEGKVKEAVEVLELLDNLHIPVDLPRYLQLMRQCGEAKSLEEAKIVHRLALQYLSPLNVSTYNRILEMYFECGSVDDALKVFNNMPERNLTTWDVMIMQLAKNGFAEDSIDLFTQFKNLGLKPDGQMFIGVFYACSILGDIDEGMLQFQSMSKDYGIAPSLAHFVSVVDMIGSVGHLDEAFEFIEKMPMEPSVDVWETLMNLCRVHGNTELADRCAELVELLDPSRLNEQSKAGLVPVKASDLTKEKEKKKLASKNLLEVRSRVHEYRAGDTSHPDNDKIYALLRGLKSQMKEAGYIPETKFVLHDIDQEGKEEALLAHSERLAVAYGLLSSSARSPIRVIKNLRVCGDCHTALKIISKIVGRELIIRDAKRFHHFKDGLCSCRDYW